ncbi:MAG: arylsulfatase, partial [Verrucomicrobiota bacterium]
PGAISAERGHVIDMMATCLELGGAEYPKEFGGKKIDPHESLSLVPVIKGGKSDREHAYIFNHSGTHAVVKGDYKIVREGKRGKWALYHIPVDRTETKNLADQHPELVASMNAIWEKRWGKK